MSARHINRLIIHWALLANKAVIVAVFNNSALKTGSITTLLNHHHGD
ncbi:MAG: hypothetical protein OFPII_13190 [Osedax symbiont Rs1]|nr:MAG: hypothetical protein OFPII_13190 [Osedax symbiont Rs1]